MKKKEFENGKNFKIVNKKKSIKKKLLKENLAFFMIFYDYTLFRH